ncbi:hypothetical protein FHX74_001966 [Friedmanniella endophytica]|uniref:Uncharacterized protein n=1 Tax=Microlunatus kandeliicorticis TaxID=1759536 RepID=A0A7W3ISB2_9ACTN|nr:hypothetical protein [Microlunatus kandeliicorticis]MBA8794347.1 hypothetical protein [Microlunatus kandeliicorticis]
MSDLRSGHGGGPDPRFRSRREPGAGPVLVDCDACAARGPACGDCVVTVLLGEPVSGVRFDPDEQHALEALAESGLVPPLRMVPRYANPPGLPLGEQTG